MKSLLAALLFSSFAFAQTQTASAKAPGCGDDNARFDVKTDSAQHLIAQPELGKALIYFLQDDSNFNARPRPTTRFGIDGAWVGATHGDSYFYAAVDPGEHHLCASWESLARNGRQSAAIHFQAEAGHSYFFRTKDKFIEHRPETIEFEEVDSDEAQLLMSKFALSTSRAKK